MTTALHSLHQYDDCPSQFTPAWRLPFTVYTSMTTALHSLHQHDDCPSQFTPSWLPFSLHQLHECPSQFTPTSWLLSAFYTNMNALHGLHYGCPSQFTPTSWLPATIYREETPASSPLAARTRIQISVTRIHHYCRNPLLLLLFIITDHFFI